MLHRCFWLLLVALAPWARADDVRATPTGITAAIPGLGDAKLDPAYWIARPADAHRLRLSSDQITVRNAHLRATEASMRDLHALAASMTDKQVRAWIEGLSQRPSRALFDRDGKSISARQINAWMRSLALKRLPRELPVRFALVTRRSNLRTFPTATRVFSTPEDREIDRFQESAFFPGTAVAIVHQSRDGHWYFVLGARYAAWISADSVAIGTRQTVLDYATRTPALVVTGAAVRTLRTPAVPELSELMLDMGTRIPVLADWDMERAVHGHLSVAHHVIELPTRGSDGRLALRPALLARNSDVRTAPLAHTAANILEQSFKFLGERYGWGHADNGRDCSGFVSEVYASMGITLPRNTGDQNRSTAFARTALGAELDQAARRSLLERLNVGDLIYLPGHVMMVIGQESDGPWVIHDAYNIALRRNAGIAAFRANGVIVTPLYALMLDTGSSYVDAIAAIQHIGPGDPR